MLNEFQLEQLQPYTGKRDSSTEIADQYCARFQTTLPHFPSEVIRQLFYEHPDTLETHAWLNYESIRFSLEIFSIEELHLPCFSDHPTINQYANHFINGNTSKRMSNIALSFENSGTWPVPPIVLFNPDAKLQTSWGLKCDSPYHLLEGHHRFAVFSAFALKGKVHPRHYVWVTKVASDNIANSILL